MHWQHEIYVVFGGPADVVLAEEVTVVESLVVEDFSADRQSEHDVSGGVGRRDDPYGIAGRVCRVLSDLN